MIRVVVFDWGDTLMRDFPDTEGPMAFWPTVELVAGVKEGLDSLDRSLVCCVASNAGASNAELLGLALERVGIRSYFQHLFTSKELGAAKPDQRFFLEIASRLGVAPSDCVMVGNDYIKDIGGAKAAGMRTVWLHAHTPAPADAPHADRIIQTLDELPLALNSLAGDTNASPASSHRRAFVP